MSDKKKKQAIVLVADLYEELELWVPFLRLKEAGVSVQLVATEAGKTYTSKYGYPAKSDVSVDEINPDEIDLVVIPGGYAPDHMRRSKKMVELVHDIYESNSHVAFICHGGWMACSAKILQGKKATSFFAIRDDMENAGAVWVDADVVHAERLISSRTPADLPAFCKEIMRAIS